MKTKIPNWAYLLVLIALTGLMISACGAPAKPGQTDTTIYVDAGMQYVAGTCPAVISTKADLAYVVVTKENTVVSVTDPENTQMNFVSWASASENFATSITKDEVVEVACGNPELAEETALDYKKDRTGWNVYLDSVEITIDRAFRLTAVMDEAGLVKEWTGAIDQISLASNGTLYYWSYATQDWLFFAVSLTTDGKSLVLGLPTGLRFKNDPMYLTDGHLMVIDDFNTSYFWIDATGQGLKVMVPERRFIFVPLK